MHPFEGSHYLSSFINCDSIPLNDCSSLIEVLKKGIEKSGATLLNECTHTFDNQSFTTVFLLSESHCSIHTYPEHGSVFIDLFTCGNHCHYQAFEDTVKEYLKPKEVVYSVIKRGKIHEFV